MITVAEALSRVLALCKPLDIETVPLREASGRVLARDVTAKRSQPPFQSSAMDGYAVCAPESRVGDRFRVIGTSAAGQRFQGTVGPGETVRIFTGAPVPTGADRIIIQENITRENDVITISEHVGNARHIRASGGDFSLGDTISAPCVITPALVALLASMNIPEIPVRRRPVIALVATGNELVTPGEEPGEDQIIASNNYGLAALFEARGAKTRLLPIARDTPASLRFVLGLCAGADMIVTIGGASVGDYDIVQPVAREMGLKTDFYKVAMRPGKPLMAGLINGVPMIGLPGNPVSSMICGYVFMLPAIDKMLGLQAEALPRERAKLAADLPANGTREHYMRANLVHHDGEPWVTPCARQDSSLLSVLNEANAMLVRQADDGPASCGDFVDVIRL